MKVVAVLLLTVSAFAQAPAADPTAPQLAHFHHLHFDSVDRLLFNKVNQPPPYEVVASLYHLGWAEKDIKAAYQHQLDIGTKFETPQGDLADLLGTGTPGAAITLTSTDPITR